VAWHVTAPTSEARAEQELAGSLDLRGVTRREQELAGSLDLRGVTRRALRAQARARRIQFWTLSGAPVGAGWRSPAKAATPMVVACGGAREARTCALG
jgi:hypothetical protein